MSQGDVHLCFDLGGTKLKGAYVNGRGRILAEATGSVRQDEGFKGLIELFREVHSSLPQQKFGKVAVASAGPLHPQKGILLDPTNFFTGNESWGVLPIVKSLNKVFKKKVILENDAAAAALGEKWRGGHGKSAHNLLAMTLGTGVGIGVVANGQLVRAGRGLHPEASHIPINSENKGLPCGCGANGCIEAYLAGTHFSKRLGELSGHEAVRLARAGDTKIQAAFKEYGRHLAQAIRSLCVVFAPEVVVLSGGFSHAHDLFLDETRAVLPGLMERYRDGIDMLPKLKVSKLQDDAGILGAAYIALEQ